jgi:N-acyl-D-aspartate/D-glutamate deacylase
MRAEFGKEIVPKLKKSKDIWMQDATLPDLSGTATLTKAETEELNKNLSGAGKVFKQIASTTLKELESNSELNMLLNVYNNSKVREGQRITDTKKHATGLVMWINNRYQKEIDKRSSDKGKQTQVDKRDALLKFFSKGNIKNLKLIFDLQNFVVNSKLILINKLNSLNKINTFVKTKSGFKVTNQEGFVAIDRMEGGAVKLVDRLEFSYNNFSKDIIKGWDSPN